MCLTGIMNLGPALDVDATTMNRNMVLHNQVLFGTVNAGLRPAGTLLGRDDGLRRVARRRSPFPA